MFSVFEECVCILYCVSGLTVTTLCLVSNTWWPLVQSTSDPHLFLIFPLHSGGLCQDCGVLPLSSPFLTHAELG